MYNFGAHWECDIRLEALLPLTPRRVYPVCIGGKRAAPSEDCWGAWGHMERMDQHRLYPPLEAMQVAAEAVSTLLAADPYQSVREGLWDLDDLREAVACLEAYQDSVANFGVETMWAELMWSVGMLRAWYTLWSAAKTRCTC